MTESGESREAAAQAGGQEKSCLLGPSEACGEDGKQPDQEAADDVDPKGGIGEKARGNISL